MSAAWDASHAPARPWRSGAWSLELRDDELADIAYDGAVVLRAVRAVVRDRNWDTATTVVESIAEGAESLELRVRSEGLGSSFTGTVRVTAAERELVVACDLRSAEAFETNRTGLVVLHPPTLAGTALTVRHPSAEERTRFPEAISPHQPVRDIAGLAWHADGLDVDVAFDGDVFEMEDQRNWSDASFKTYSRPLDLPFPYPIAAGERVQQALRIAVAGAATMHGDGGSPSRIVLRPTGAAFPRIGTGAGTGPGPVPASLVQVDHVLVELDLASATWRTALVRAASSGRPLDVRLVLDEDRPEALREGVAALHGLDVLRVTAFRSAGPAAHVSDGEAIRALRDALDAAGLDIPVIGGARSHFTQLNREQHRLPADLAGVAFSITPMFHSTTTEQLVESLAVQRLLAEQALAIAPGTPVQIGPISLRAHLNDVATTPPPRSPHVDLRKGYGPHLLGADDPRQSAPELAAWTVASAAALTVPCVASLTYFEEWGPRGIVSASGERYPVAAAIEALQRLEGGVALSGPSPDGLVWTVGALEADQETVLVANLDRHDRDVAVITPFGELVARVPAGDFVILAAPAREP